ncbi:unnamed protein product [Zymoseptoria tritici ST99CH_1A5]|uniref:Uncharacterized protein n=3 Tax=Zymoseptoria tritici TaxID=1047171 RepID=A0A1X7S6H6_ZYMT9|nr:unnamed protein product [Zymoseptoria tritici ST99CH_3D7]SMR60328.1 unnamed protein product [Zymoseptoria tritici ST99CH_1E4]SMR63441.1 unnamed protein product [Zymoseptoria tritici ST99CH_3D1]SMY28785.1 unnamed protein product [Zymoseptoria tritici ST99CH_1A5]
MAASVTFERPEEVATKVMRRVQVSKMTRALQDRLALANVKIQNGWQNMSLDAIEPQVEERLKRRKRPASSNDTISDSASTTSSRLQSSPLTEPLFSDDYPPRSGGSYRPKRIRTAMNPPPILAPPSIPITTAQTGRRTRTAASRQPTWKKASGLAESSPIKHTKHTRLPSHNVSHLSFTEDDEPPSPEFSEDDDTDLPLTSFAANNNKTSRTTNATSPPHTPPPDRHVRHINQVSWSRTPRTSHNPDDGADLLMYLATSPSPAIGSHRITNRSNIPQPSTVIAPPSTPPCKSTPLPSSHMTPGFLGGFGAPNTPGNTFNFADFVTLTPSPAQVHWSRTPVVGGRTPGQVGTSARRRLNFEGGLMPPGGLSPVMTRGRRDGGEGLGMELGGELVS